MPLNILWLIDNAGMTMKYGMYNATKGYGTLEGALVDDMQCIECGRGQNM